ncbi:MAG: phosphate starvation-inducible protein PsiF, partial [Burkholderiales bacterium]|nr:phosphate starvation-inducible protein PsiF [Burkholderiales bacterium]
AASAAPAASATQQDKMKSCNVDAKGKKGDERKAFMKECLSSKPA